MKAAIGFFILAAIVGLFCLALLLDWIAQKVMHYREGKAMKKRDLIRDRDMRKWGLS